MFSVAVSLTCDPGAYAPGLTSVPDIKLKLILPISAGITLVVKLQVGPSFTVTLNVFASFSASALSGLSYATIVNL